MNRHFSKYSSARALSAVALMVLSCGLGCKSAGESTGLVLGEPDRISTPSVEKVREAKVDIPVHRRPFQLTMVSAKDATVTHTPLFFEDPCETPGERLSFEWTGDDYFHLLYGPARFLASTLLVPLSAIDTPPWQMMESDGQLKVTETGH